MAEGLHTVFLASFLVSVVALATASYVPRASTASPSSAD
jgi:hypothetical protein